MCWMSHTGQDYGNTISSVITWQTYIMLLGCGVNVA